MDQIIAGLVAAISAGAAAMGKEAATQATKDAYATVKRWLQGHYPAVSIDHLEQLPASKARQLVVAKDLEQAGANGDTELVKLARTLVQTIQAQSPEVARSIGVDMGEVDRANVIFANVTAGADATGVRLGNVTDSTLHFGDITARSQPDRQKKAKAEALSRSRSLGGGQHRSSG